MSDGTRLRVTSDGTSTGTRVETEDGQLVHGIQRIEWRAEIGAFAVLSIDVLAVACDVVGLVPSDDGSMPEDPTAIPLQRMAQEPPEGPGFPERDDG